MNRDLVSMRVKTKLGWIEVAATDNGIALITLPNGWSGRANSSASPESSKKAMAFARNTANKLGRYFAGEAVDFDDVPLDFDGAPRFFRRVWLELRKVPRGETISYGELAGRARKPKAARAVGAAMAANPVPIIIPCHRVIRSDGSLGGFGGGINLKKKMLELESIRD